MILHSYGDNWYTLVQLVAYYLIVSVLFTGKMFYKGAISNLL